MTADQAAWAWYAESREAYSDGWDTQEQEYAEAAGDSTIYECYTGKCLSGDKHLLPDPKPGKWGKGRRLAPRPVPYLQVVHNNARAEAAGLPATLLYRQWRAMLTASGGRCTYCGRPDGVYLDHVIPMSAGGGTELTNVAPCCLSCNSSKCGHPLWDWLAQRTTSGLEVEERIRLLQEAAK